MTDEPKLPILLYDQLATVRTSELLAMMNPDIAAEIIRETGGTCDASAFVRELAAEIDRRIPPRDPRVGKLCRLSARVSFPHPDRVGRIVAVDPSGALRFREETWTEEYLDLRVAAAEVVEWLEESPSSGTRPDVTEKQAERDAELRAALAKSSEMTSEQRERQRESFARGNVAAGEDD